MSAYAQFGYSYPSASQVSCMLCVFIAARILKDPKFGDLQRFTDIPVSRVKEMKGRIRCTCNK